MSTVAWVGWERWEVRRAGQEAVRLAQQGRFRDAEPKLRLALEHDPDNIELLEGTGRSGCSARETRPRPIRF